MLILGELDATSTTFGPEQIRAIAELSGAEDTAVVQTLYRLNRVAPRGLVTPDDPAAAGSNVPYTLRARGRSTPLEPNSRAMRNLDEAYARILDHESCEGEEGDLLQAESRED